MSIRTPLAGAAALSSPGLDCVLNCGQFLLGRDPTCWVCVDDPLASRQHARIIVTPESVIITDAGSANGVYVNNTKLTEPRALFHGDRILVGSTEIVVGKARASQRPSLPPEDRTTLTGVLKEQRSVATVRAGSLDVLGRVAERMLAAGNAERAKAVLSDQLVKLLEGARTGEQLRDDLCEAASRYALKLAEALREGKWIDYTIELHLRSGKCLAPGTLADLTQALEKVSHVDNALFSSYVTALVEAAPSQARYAEQVAHQLGKLQLPPPHPA